MNLTIDYYIIDNIISYLNIQNKIFINKRYHKQSIDKLKKNAHTIEKFYLYNKLRLEMAFEYYDNDDILSIRSYYIIFYPKEYRKNIYEQTLKYLRTDFSKEKLNYIQNLYNMSIVADNYNLYFKDLINQLNANHLAFIGW
jgi:hypothetical protein